MKINRRHLGWIALAIGVWTFIASERSLRAETDTDTGAIQIPTQLTKLNIEELMDIEITSVKKSPEKLSDAAAAITVITGEDIRRSGVTSIPEALRMAPGLDVARVDSHTWAISSRGFNDIFANKLLVLIDGRSVYTPLFSGVYWDVQDMVLEDVDRIEVIRGPGATLWGANAVNGVINIISKSAKETQGGMVAVGGGTEERGSVTARYGDKVGETLFYRAYFKYFDRDASVLTNRNNGEDAWNMARGGFRTDWQPSDPSLFTLQGDIYGGRFDQLYQAPVAPKPPATFPALVTRDGEGRTDGGNMMGRWTRTFSAESDLELQTYYDRTSRKSIVDFKSIPFNEDRDTFDASLQNRFPLGARQDLVWGVGYRLSREVVRNNYSVSLTPDQETTHLESAFVQDEVTLVENRLRFTFGTKLEHNDYTGIEVQPSGRLIWTPQERQSVWLSVSRAVRTPSRIEEDVLLHTFQPPGILPFPAVAQTSGTENFQSEKLMAYEAGYRIQPQERVSFDLAAFYNVYDDLRTIERRGLISPPPFAVGTAQLQNLKRAEGFGGEISANWKPLDWWRLRASYSRLDLQEHLDSGSLDASIQSLTDTSPRNQASIYSSMDLTHNVEFDWDIRYVDELSNPSQAIPAYTTMDVRIGWRPYPNLEFSVVGTDLFSPRHLEFRPTNIITQTTEVERAVYGKITWRF